MEKTALQMFTSTVKDDNEHIFIKPLCDFFKIDTEKQVIKIKNDQMLANCYAKKSNKLPIEVNYPDLKASDFVITVWKKPCNLSQK